MKLLLRSIRAVLSSRATAPFVIGFFMLVYIGIAFFTDETLTTLMEFTRRSIVLAILLALLPLNTAIRVVSESGRYLKMRRSLTGDATAVPKGLFDETVELPAASFIAGLESRLGSVGYKTRRTERALTAWEGISIFPARLLYLAGTFCLFAGILISLTTRTSLRGAIIEGEPLSAQTEDSGIVERILLANASGTILAKTLILEVAGASTGGGKKSFGLYPPSTYRGAYVYPRYLGIGLLVSLSAPDLPAVHENHSILAIYPPGKEATTEIPGSPYQIVFSLMQPDDGSDPYMTGQMLFRFKLLKEKEVVLTGSLPGGGEFVRDGYRLSLPDFRRLVITDFIRDYGVLLIWVAAILFITAVCIWLPIRLFFPRREMLFLVDSGGIKACSRAEGRHRTHAGIFHEALDLLDAKKP